MKPNWTAEQRQWVASVAKLWSEGSTQLRIAEQMGVPHGTLISKLVSLGVRFERQGLKLVWTATGEPVDLDEIAA